jgi:hypothetical protein
MMVVMNPEWRRKGKEMARNIINSINNNPRIRKERDEMVARLMNELLSTKYEEDNNMKSISHWGMFSVAPDR